MSAAAEGLLWNGGVRFQDALDNLLGYPCLQPDAFDERFNPPRRCIAVLGHELSTKCAAVIDYCRRHNLEPLHFSLDPLRPVGPEVLALNEQIERMLVSDARARILVLEHADRLAFDADTPEARSFAVHLERIAEHYNLLWVCLMDRPKMAGPSNPLFWRQFVDAVVYYGPPDSTWTKRYLKARLQAFQSHYDTAVAPRLDGRRLKVELSDADYTVLADAMRDASAGHIDAYLRSVCRALCAPHWPLPAGEHTAGIDFFAGPPFVNSAEGTPHILRSIKNVRTAESYFADAAGGSAPVAAPNPSSAWAPKKAKTEL